MKTACFAMAAAALADTALASRHNSTVLDSFVAHPCDNMQNTNGRCVIRWDQIKDFVRPTQNGVGYGWVKRKLDKDFGSRGDAQDEMDDTPIPVVYGPERFMYMVDSHHTLSALDVSPYWDRTDVTLRLLCDYSDLSLAEFWDKMERNNFAYLLDRPANSPNALPTRQDPLNLPKAVDMRAPGGPTLRDTPWRALAGYVRKVQEVPGFGRCSVKDCWRGFDRICGADGGATPFFEYHWSYFMNAAYLNSDLWDDQDARRNFVQKYEAMPWPAPDWDRIDQDQWEDLAASLVVLCRSDTAGSYVLPESLGSPIGGANIPGYRRGMTPFPQRDPSCNFPTCPNNKTFL